jgi:hypothetical protein
MSQMITPVRALQLGAVLLASVFAFGGCGSTYLDDDNGYNPGDDGYPLYVNMTLVWKVIDPDGYPIGGVTMWLDGAESMYLTDPEFTPLGNNYPYNWRGWLCNWISDEYRAVINYHGDSDSFELRATKPGWTDASTILEVNEYDYPEVFIRGTLVMYPIDGLQVQGVASQAKPEVQKAPAGFKRAPGHEPKFTVGGEQGPQPTR